MRTASLLTTIASIHLNLLRVPWRLTHFKSARPDITSASGAAVIIKPAACSRESKAYPRRARSSRISRFYVDNLSAPLHRFGIVAKDLPIACESSTHLPYKPLSRISASLSHLTFAEDSEGKESQLAYNRIVGRVASRNRGKPV